MLTVYWWRTSNNRKSWKRGRRSGRRPLWWWTISSCGSTCLLWLCPEQRYSSNHLLFDCISTITILLWNSYCIIPDGKTWIISALLHILNIGQPRKCSRCSHCAYLQYGKNQDKRRSGLRTLGWKFDQQEDHIQKNKFNLTIDKMFL